MVEDNRSLSFLKTALSAILYLSNPTVQNRKVPGVVPWGPPGPWLWAEVPAGTEGRWQVPVPVGVAVSSSAPSSQLVFCGSMCNVGQMPQRNFTFGLYLR